MPAYLLKCQSFSWTRTKKTPSSQIPGISPIGSLRAIRGKSGYFSRALGLLLTITITVTIFVVLPTSDGNAEMNLPGMQSLAGRTASFDRKESVLDRFRAFTGKKNTPALEGLFTRWDPLFRQDPAVLLSDGKTVTRITLRLQGRAGDPPVFSITGGHCVSAIMTNTGEWILEILPNRGTLSTSLTVAFPGQMTEYPLTVAPPMYLFETRNADTAVIEYVKTANHLATPGTNPERK